MFPPLSHRHTCFCVQMRRWAEPSECLTTQMQPEEVSWDPLFVHAMNCTRRTEGGRCTSEYGSCVWFLFSVCSGPSAEPQQNPFLCLDLVYISVLLQEFGFPPHQQLRVSPPSLLLIIKLIVSSDWVSVPQLARTINQVETSWALGATFNYMETLRGS